jgi:DNA repair protein RadD
MALRPYQAEAVDAATAWMRRSVMPGLLELATGAGKSHIVAAIAKLVYESTGKRVLCLQPSKELTEQNHAKYLETGNKASIFSASAGGKCMRHPVVYGTPGTVKNSLSRFGDQFGAVIIDEAHGITETIKMIVGSMQKANPYLRVLGMTATPYRSLSGFIYQYDVDGSFVPEDEARDPWFNTLLYRITTNELIDMGFLTPAHADPDHAESYEAAGIQLNRQGKFDAADLERVFEGRGRLTSQIVADVVAHSHGRRGVMLFAATVQHAKEIMESLPPINSRMLGGDVNMGKSEREQLVNDFKAMKFKYLVSVATLTTGFDAPHVDLIALLRATESPGLLQQIIGRGLRLCDGKEDCLVLDYAENIDRHQLHSDLFKPQIKVKGAKGGGGTLTAVCPSCGFENEFSARPNPDQFNVSQDGYFLDLSGLPVEVEGQPMPAHFGRRCNGQVKSLVTRGVYERCDQRWSSKECPECQADNDIAARYCCACKEELVDPNEKLSREFIKVKKDPYAISTDKVLSWTRVKSMSQSGNETLRCTFVTEYRSFDFWFTPDSRASEAQAAWRMLNNAVYRGHQAPSIDVFLQHFEKSAPLETVTYCKKRGKDFYQIFGFNKPADKDPTK